MKLKFAVVSTLLLLIFSAATRRTVVANKVSVRWNMDGAGSISLCVGK